MITGTSQEELPFMSMTYREFKEKIFDMSADALKYTDEFLFDIFLIYKFTYEKSFRLEKVTKFSPFDAFVKEIKSKINGTDS
jgi:hypothetical protein